MTLTARPPAKLNLTLEVGPRGDDGFHPLRSVFLRIGLSDRLVARQIDGSRDRLAVTGPLPVPVESNIVLRALWLVRREAGLPLPALELDLEKHIPLGAGLAGGSSDGAAALELAAAAWGVGLSPQMHMGLAAELGSDVPFFAGGAPAALVEGRGERVTPLPAVEGRPGVLLVTPPIEISTSAAFARFDDLEEVDAEGGHVTDELAAALRVGLTADELPGWADRLHNANDLWPAAAHIAPELPRLRGHLEQATGRPWMLTGSGSSLFAFYASPEEAASAGAELLDSGNFDLSRTMLCAVDLEGEEPVWRQP